MLNGPTPEPSTGFRNYVIVSLVAFIFVGLYLGWIFYSRSQVNQAIVEKAAEKRLDQDRRTFEMMGGNRFDILGFYADPGTIQAGDRSSLCYSVSNAKSVKLDPQTEPVWPAFSHCVNVSPRKTTKYTLTIDDGAGHTKTRNSRSQSALIQSAECLTGGCSDCGAGRPAGGLFILQ